MWNNTNPAELFSGTTWELITAGKYIQSGSTALQTGGSNSINIQKTNLPNVKLKVDSFSLTTQPHYHATGLGMSSKKGIYGNYNTIKNALGWDVTTITGRDNFKTSTDDGANTGTASPNTENLGNGTALNIQPAYITLKLWKRLT